MKHVKFVGVDYTMSQIHPSRVDETIFMKNAKWAEAIESDFKKKVLKFRNSSSVPKAWAIEGSKKIAELYSHEEVSRIYDQKLSEYLK